MFPDRLDMEDMRLMLKECRLAGLVFAGFSVPLGKGPHAAHTLASSRSIYIKEKGAADNLAAYELTNNSWIKQETGVTSVENLDFEI